MRIIVGRGIYKVQICYTRQNQSLNETKCIPAIKNSELKYTGANKG